jgi:hypothetical protein
VLDTGTKGTGAEMVPLERVLNEPPRERGADFVPPQPRPRPAAAPEPRQPRRFRVVEVTTGRALADDVGARGALEALERVPSFVDARVYVWQPRAERWRLLTIAEQKAMWSRRGLPDV